MESSPNGDGVATCSPAALADDLRFSGLTGRLSLLAAVLAFFAAGSSQVWSVLASFVSLLLAFLIVALELRLKRLVPGRWSAIIAIIVACVTLAAVGKQMRMDRMVEAWKERRQLQEEFIEEPDRAGENLQHLD
jgi:hypothetical protein